jgi:hypothetical protein
MGRIKPGALLKNRVTIIKNVYFTIATSEDVECIITKEKFLNDIYQLP